MIGKEKERGDLFMNKNLKRALNTTAAVSMSLAMVLGAVNPVKVEAATAACAQSVINGYEEVLEKLENAGGLENLQLATELEDKYATSGDYLGALTVKEYLSEGAEGYVAVKAYYDQCATRAEQEEVEKVLNFVTNVVKLEESIDTMATKLEGAWKDALPEDAVKEARTIYNNITNKYADYQGNVSDEHAEKLAGYLEDLGYLLEDYTDDNYSKIAKAYAKELRNIKVATVTLGAFVDGTEALQAKFEKQAEKVLEQITEDKLVVLTEISKYEDVADYEAVAEIMDELEAAVEAMPEANDLQSTKLDEYKAFNKVQGKFEKLTDGKDWEENFDAKLKLISTSDLKAFTEYYETVVSKFYEVEIKERANGDFKVTWQNGEYAKYLNSPDVVLEDTYKKLAVVVNKDEETTYLDLVLNRATDVEAAIKAVTTDLKGITVNNMTVKDVKAIQAAEDAMIKLAGDTAFGTGIFEEKGEYTHNLTSAQKKEVKNAYRNVKALVDAMYDKGLVSLIVGWVETAQGWEYYDNNGNRVMEGWAAGNGYWSFMKNGYSVSNEWCAANDGWYYMGADGKMVTGKVVIDGVEQDFGTDGIWVR